MAKYLVKENISAIHKYNYKLKLQYQVSYNQSERRETLVDLVLDKHEKK